MSSSLSLDLSNRDYSIPEKDQDNQDGFGQIEKKPMKIIPIGNILICMHFKISINLFQFSDKDGTLSKLFIHSSHVLNPAEQILLEYLDQPKSSSATKCELLIFSCFNKILMSSKH